MTFVILWIRRNKRPIFLIPNRKTFFVLLSTALLLISNWGVYIWAVQHDLVLETSLGYYACPLVTIFLGFAVLGERFSSLQWIAIVLAGIAVLIPLVAYGQFPWVAMTIACSFSVYALLRKQVKLDALNALWVETTLLVPFSIYYLMGHRAESIVWGERVKPWIALLLVMTGLVTSVPLILYAVAVKRMKLSALGFLQFLTPTISFGVAVLIYHEAFTVSRAFTFGLIWLAIVLFLWDGFRTRRRRVA